jgi:hypothetical protein
MYLLQQLHRLCNVQVVAVAAQQLELCILQPEQAVIGQRKTISLILTCLLESVDVGSCMSGCM